MELNPGEVVFGEVIGLKPYGAFVRLPTEEVGMVHISEIAPKYVKDISEYLLVGMEVCVKLIGRNTEGKWNLSLKQITKQEQESSRFRREVEAFRRALAEKEQIPAEPAREVRRVRKPSPTQESVIAWGQAARREMDRLRRNQQQRRRVYERD